MTGTLSRIQELFHLHSDFKDGPKAGKVNDEQLKTVVLSSGQFVFEGQDVELRCADYSKLLDADKDGLISFFDFITPLLPILPPEVTTMFTQDQRFKQETFNDMRIAFDQVSTKEEDKKTKASIITLKTKLSEHSRGVELTR
jgi:hypothetical protein